MLAQIARFVVVLAGLLANEGTYGQSSYFVTIISNPAGTPVSGSTNTFDYPILSSVTLTCRVTSWYGSRFFVTNYQWNTTECYTNYYHDYPTCFPTGQTAQSVTGNNLLAEDAGNITCTVTIGGAYYTSGPLTLRISGIALTGSSYGGPSGDLVINNKIADYSFVTQPFSLDEHKSILRCATGLGPSYWDNNAVLGGWYFKGAQIPVGRNCYGYGFEVRGASVRNYPGVINLYLCETFNTTEEGLYSCIMMNSSMMKQTVRVGLYLSGRTVPIIDPPSSSTVIIGAGSPLTLSCTSRGSPPDTFTWSKDSGSGSIVQSASITTVTHTSASAVFRIDYFINSVTTSDNGTYTCTVTNPIGSDSETITVIVTIPGVFTQHPFDQIVQLHFDVSLRCRAVGSNIVVYQWTHNNNLIIPNNHYIVKGSDLRIVNATMSDAGRYQCIITNINGMIASDYATLIVSRYVPAPEIIAHPTDTSAAAPFSGVFTCSASGYGYMNITWFKNNQVYNAITNKSTIHQTSSMNITTSTLVIYSVTEDDMGAYHTLVWVSSKASQSRTASLLFSGIPSQPVTLFDSHIHLTVNDYRLSMKCMPQKSYLNYKWERSGGLPSSAQGIYTSHLVIINLRPEDAGDYRCIVSNSTGTISSNFSPLLISVSPPVVISHPSAVTVNAFESAIFQCSFRSFGVAKIVWKKKGCLLPETASESITRKRNIVTSKLQINRAVGYYSGDYYCVAKNVAGEVLSMTADLYVKVPCPEIFKPPINNSVLFGQTANYYCLALSFGLLTYEWKKFDGKNLLPTTITRYTNKNILSGSTIVSNLKIPNVKPSDEGEYCCVAINECGNVTKCAWLDVITLPNITKQPLSIALRAGARDKIVMQCEAVGIGFINYHWEKYHLSNNSWEGPHRAVKITSSKLTYRLILEEDEGIYRCVVSNGHDSVVSDNATLTVYGPPTSVVSKSITSFEGEKANLMCNATNDIDAVHPVQVNWYKGSLLLRPDGRRVLAYHKLNTTKEIVSVILFDPVNHTDDGEYTCRSFNDPLAFTEVTTTLTVEYSPQVIISPSSPHTAVVGSQLKITCTANGLPTPTVQWFRSGVAVSPVALKSVQYSVVSSHPQLNVVYICVSKNYAGNITQTVYADIIVNVIDMGCHPLLNAPNHGIRSVINIGGIAKYIIFTCKPGYLLKGASSAECIGGKWSHASPTCVKI